jgi:hypothetical protein
MTTISGTMWPMDRFAVKRVSEDWTSAGRSAWAGVGVRSW